MYVLCVNHTQALLLNLSHMQIHETEHYKHPWIAHELLKDFEVEDVWRFPVELKENHDIHLFQTEMMAGLGELQEKGLPGLLFKLRFFLGRIFGWDDEHEEEKKHNPKIPGSLRERYIDTYDLKIEELPDPGSAEFIPVYTKEDESLAEIKNATVHAGLHLGKVEETAGSYTVQMAVYVKPNGLFGKIYMAIIKPFRYLIVYPVLMKSVGIRWKGFLAGAS